jgi:hypothetical protein
MEKASQDARKKSSGLACPGFIRHTEGVGGSRRKLPGKAIRRETGGRIPFWRLLAMTRSEQDILAIFRRFRVGPNKMLCFNSFVDEKFLAAMDLLIKHQLVVKDRPKHAYYLTQAGYDASLSA